MLTPIEKQPRTPAQILASQINGSKSIGAITKEGKRAIANNRMTHGFRSNAIVLSNEDAATYNNHLDQYLLRYAPKDKVEEDLVGLLASSMWQIMRNSSIELALFELELAGIISDLDPRVTRIDQYGLLAMAFKRSAGDNAFELLRRYKTMSERTYHRALQAIDQIQKDRPVALAAPVSEEPKNLSTVPTRDESVAAESPVETPVTNEEAPADLPLEPIQMDRQSTPAAPTAEEPRNLSAVPTRDETEPKNPTETAPISDTNEVLPTHELILGTKRRKTQDLRPISERPAA